MLSEIEYEENGSWRLLRGWIANGFRDLEMLLSWVSEREGEFCRFRGRGLMQAVRLSECETST
jgi:hypothetical protein